MEYKLLVLASETQLATLNFSDMDTPEYVSIDGNNTLGYTGTESTDLLVQYVKEYFNIDAFSDLELKVILLGFDLSSTRIHELYMAFRCAKSLSVMDANAVLPILLLQKTSVSPCSQHRIAAFGNAYEVTVDKDCNFQCSPIPLQEDLQEADIESYLFLFRFSSAGMAEDPQKELQHQEELQQLQQLLSLKEQQLKEVEKELKDAKELLDIVGYGENLEKEHSREFHYCTEDAWGYLQHNLSDGELVAEGDVIGYTKSTVSRGNTTIKANRGGKVFYFVKNGEYISKESDSPFAVISDLSDTREKIIEWHKRKTGQQLPDEV